MSRRLSRLPFFVIFTASGFAGLIYESIWSHYLKLFLGHAAYAQTLVLAIFMGGMAVGSWICSRFSHRWPRLLRGYALAEAAVGAAALLFHPLYTAFLDFAYDELIPWLGAGTLVTAAKWSLSGLLILPQSVLLGMTFPLMTSGLLRRFPDRSGATVATLYFTNSLGAACGVLASGFLFLAWVGLPGTLRIAGGLNLALAAAVLYLAGPEAEPAPVRPAAGEEAPGARRFLLVLLGTAAVTGAASFCYEIAWIRMLCLVLGSSTHAFELMLSAFITGLAFGGLWIRRRIDRLRDPVGFLAGVQLAMGLAALLTLPLYGNCFAAMRFLLEHLEKNAAGYLEFNLGSHAIALAIMLPATFCAGTTLPLITHTLLRRGVGERSIGAVYAWNTVGSILGVFLAVHLALPLVGLKGLVAAGVALDLSLGLGLAWWVWGGRKTLLAVTAATAAVFAGVLLGVRLDAHQMASGVYRTGEMLEEGTEVLFHRDGKTATVSVTRDRFGGRSIRTNGKPDAKLNPLSIRESLDEHTMTLLGILPLAAKPDARTAANIGFGSGLTTQTLLSTGQLERLDTIEIEPAMVEGARLFGDRVARAFLDPRSHIHFEDAKTFFSARGERYDLIVSEPSNPWVSGVAGLFSREFYRRAKDHLADGGLLVQWLQYYEIDLRLVTSVWKALATEFAYFEVYTANRGDMVILASASTPVPPLDPAFFDQPGAAALLRRLRILSPADLSLRWLANRRALEPFLAADGVPANSDYAPVVDLEAARTRFLGLRASELLDPDLEMLPVLELLGGRPPLDDSPIQPNPAYDRTYQVAIASMILEYQLGGEWLWNDPDQEISTKVRGYAEIARRAILGCEQRMPPERWFNGMYNSVAKRLLPFAGRARLEPLWQRLESPACRGQLDALQRGFVELWEAVARRDTRGMRRASQEILALAGRQLPPELLHYVVSAGMLGALVEGDRAAALSLWDAHSPRMGAEERATLATRILRAHAGVAPDGAKRLASGPGPAGKQGGGAR